MFTRIVECRVKPDKRDDFNNKLRNDVLPILQKQPGFVDLIGLTSESDAERVISVSFWKNKEDAAARAMAYLEKTFSMYKAWSMQEPDMVPLQLDPSIPLDDWTVYRLPAEALARLAAEGAG